MRLDSSPQLLHAQLKITQLASFAFCRFLVYCCIKVLPNLIFTLAIFNFFQWPTFFSDLLQCLQFGAKAVDMYLRILKAIDEEVVDRDVTRNQQVCVCLNWTIISSNSNINPFFSLISFLFFLIGGWQKHEDQRCYQRDLHHKSCGLLVSNLGMFSVLCNMTWHLNRTVEEK